MHCACAALWHWAHVGNLAAWSACRSSNLARRCSSVIDLAGGGRVGGSGTKAVARPQQRAQCSPAAHGAVPAGAGARRRGAGLGLSIVKMLVELHGGTLEIDSTLGEGTEVKVTIPTRPTSDEKKKVEEIKELTSKSGSWL